MSPLQNPLDALRGAQPSPRYRLAVDGKDITSSIDSRLICLTMTDSRGFEADTLEVQLDDTDGKLDLPRRGASMRLWLGWEGSPLVDKGTFTVDELEHSGAPDVLSIRGKSVDLRDAMQQQREKSYHDTTVKGIVDIIAARHKLTPSLTADLGAQTISHIDQQNESDAAFLTRLAGQFDAIATVKDGRLLFIRAGQATTASGKPLPAVTITRAEGDSHRFAVADRDAYTGVIAYWHDHKAAQKKAVSLKRRKKTTTTKALDPNLSVNKKENELLMGSRDNVKTLRHTYANQRNAERAARAEWQRLQRGVAEFSINLARGRPELIPELPATVQGFKPQIDAAKWLLTRITHTLSDSGYTTGLELEVKLEELPE